MPVGSFASRIYIEGLIRSGRIHLGTALQRIFYRFKGRKLRVVQMTFDFLDLSNVDVAHDVAGLWIDRDWTARALPCHALHGVNQCIAVGIATGFFSAS